MKKKSIILLIIFVLFNCFIFAEALTPGDASSAQSDSITNVFNDLHNYVGKDEFEYVKPTKIEITNKDSMLVGETIKLSPKITPSNTTNTATIYESLTPDIATVDMNGNVYAIKKGEATIRVKCDDDESIFVDFVIIINEQEKILPTEISFQNNSAKIKNKRATYIQDLIGNIIFSPGDCTDRSVRYEVSNNYGSINGDYLISNEPGDLILKAILNSNNSIYCEMKVTILDDVATKPKTITIKNIDDVYINRYAEIDVEFDKENIDDKTLNYIIETEDLKTIASYNVKNGLKGIREGKGTVQACSVYNNEICSNKMEFEVNKVSLDNLEIKYNEHILEYFKSGEKIKLSYALYPSDVTYKDVEWSVNSDNAKISQSGLLVALKEGTTTVTLKHLDSGLTATHEIKIFKASALNRQQLDELEKNIRKLIGHFSLFAIDGIIGFLFFMSLDIKKRDKTLILIATGILIAVIAELLQLIPEGRSCQFSDMVINSSGFLMGIALSLIFFKIKSRIEQRRKN